MFPLPPPLCGNRPTDSLSPVCPTLRAHNKSRDDRMKSTRGYDVRRQCTENAKKNLRKVIVKTQNFRASGRSFSTAPQRLQFTTRASCIPSEFRPRRVFEFVQTIKSKNSKTRQSNMSDGFAHAPRRLKKNDGVYEDERGKNNTTNVKTGSGQAKTASQRRHRVFSPRLITLLPSRGEM